MNGFVVGGTESGVGKTVVTLAIIQALQEAGATVQPAKAGPDYIDPSHHATVADRPSRTLDPWLQGANGLCRNYHRGTGDVCVIEGMMGVYDGERSSTAAVAEALDVPIVLVVDGSASMESVAATAYGFSKYGDEAGLDVEVAGIVAQRTHGGRHARGIREALPDGLAYFGRIPPREELDVPERHLGLHMGTESALDPAVLAEVATHVDVDGLRGVASAPPKPERRELSEDSGLRIAVAQDEAFQFIYPGVRERLERRATVVPFAPTADEQLPPCDGVYLPGGYPELSAGALAGSGALETLSRRGSDGLPVFGECGGMMVLAETLTTAEGETHQMAGLLPAEVAVSDRYQALDHVELAATKSTLTATRGEVVRGHEFHYSSASVGRDATFAFDVRHGDGIDGSRDGLTEFQTLGTYTHVHAESGAFDTFVDRIAEATNG